MNKRTMIVSLVVALLLVAAAGTVWAGGGAEREAVYPSRTVSVTVPWAAGGGTDRVARFWADAFQQELGVPFVVENRTGGGGAVGHSAGARAAADGYTITMVTFELATLQSMGLADLTYAGYDYILQMNEDAASVIVRADSPYQSIQDLFDAIEANPGQVSFSGTAVGGVWDLARVGMLLEAGIDPDDTLWIPSEGAAPAITDLLGGHVDVITNSLPEAQSQLEAGNLRALAVMSDQRNPAFPDVPTLKEQGIDWSGGTWRGFAVPAGTPENVRQVLVEAGEKIARSTEFENFMADAGFGIRLRLGDEYAEFVENEHYTWQTIIREIGF
ncbi:MAG: tripartite tricarboxylate transporter substrate binding protein [Spirochaetaceae bacterium]|nr:MAG: tripartite tricarboxylate transporter substrate binding protein [Spirochaetaceae bacterium]